MEAGDLRASRDDSLSDPRSDLNMIEDNFIALRELLSNDKLLWEHLGEVDGVQISRTKHGRSDVFVMRGDVVLPFPPQTVMELISDLQNRGRWDELFEGMTVVRPIYDRGPGQRAFICHMRYRSPGFLVTARDFVTLTAATFQPEEGAGALFSRSVPDASVPEHPAYIRGELLTSGYTLAPADATKASTRVTYVVQLDPRGWLPVFVVNSVARQQPLTLARFRAYMLARLRP